jgi:hypothetical protein
MDETAHFMDETAHFIWMKTGLFRVMDEKVTLWMKQQNLWKNLKKNTSHPKPYGKVSFSIIWNDPKPIDMIWQNGTYTYVTVHGTYIMMYIQGHACTYMHVLEYIMYKHVYTLQCMYHVHTCQLVQEMYIHVHTMYDVCIYIGNQHWIIYHVHTCMYMDISKVYDSR